MTINLNKQITYYADGPRARITRFKGEGKYYIRFEVFCNQAQELVTSKFALGTGTELRDRWIAWQNEGYNHADKFGKVSLGVLDG